MDGEFPRPPLAPSERLRVAFLAKQMSPHSAASIRALMQDGAHVWCTHRAPSTDAPFADEGWGFPSLRWVDRPPLEMIRDALHRFRPHAVVVTSWNITDYRRLSRQMAGGPLRILAMDNQWLGTAKQRIGSLASTWYIQPAFDVAWVPSDAAARFARRLGFAPHAIWSGLLSADVSAFAPVAERVEHGSLPEAFVFVGRLIAEKGVDTLAEGFRIYRALAASPWPMLVAGTGPAASTLADVEGIELLGFVAPEDLPAVLARASCLVLPSRFEPWGVAVHEATSAGLAVIATSACGAVPRLVLDGFNGRVTSPGDARELAEAMVEHSGLAESARRDRGRRSAMLSTQYSPQRWAEHLERGVRAAFGTTSATGSGA